jgi:exodeoxyribonuclease-5
VSAHDWSPQQLDAINRAVKWYGTTGRPRQRVFRLFGFAGTGKTTLASEIAERLGVADSTVYAAFTGKAVNVLRSKGAEPASTVHSLIYTPTDKSRERLKALQTELAGMVDPGERKRLEREVKAEEARLREPDFTLNPSSSLGFRKLLILDEASMIDADLADDIESFRVPVIALGDPMQLPPVGDRGRNGKPVRPAYMTDNPDVMLTEIHRSALDNPVTRLTLDVRQATEEGDTRRAIRGLHVAPDVDGLLAADQILCARNATRWNATRSLRGALGRPDGEPVPGDRVVILANNREHGVYNGQLMTVDDVRPAKGRAKGRLLVTATDDMGEVYTLRAWARGFLGTKEDEGYAREHARTADVAMTFANVLTVHKAQGSQWGHVAVIDESPSWWGLTLATARAAGVPDGLAYQRAAHESGRWLYTAVSRASERVTLVDPKGLPW